MEFNKRDIPKIRFLHAKWLAEILFLIVLTSVPLRSRAGLVSLLLKGQADVGDRILQVSKVDYWAFLPQYFDSFKVDNNGGFRKIVVCDSDRPFFLFCGKKNLGLIFPKANQNDSVELSIDLSGHSFEIQGPDRIFYKAFYKFYNLYRTNGGFDEHYTGLLKLNSKSFCDSLSADFQRKTRYIKSIEDIAPNSMRQFLEKTIRYEMMAKVYDYQEKHFFYLTGKWAFLEADSNLIQLSRRVTINEEDLWVPDCGQALKYQLEVIVDSLRSRDSILKRRPSILVKYECTGWRFEHGLRDFAAMLTIKELVDAARKERHYRVADSLVLDLKDKAQNRQYSDFALHYCRTKNPFYSEIDFVLKSSEGKISRLSSYSNPIKVLFFWGTWCGPCKKFASDYSEIAALFAENAGILFVNVALESQSWDRWKSSPELSKFPGLHLYAEGQFANPQLQQFNIQSVPRIVIVRNGKVHNFNASLIKEDLIKELKALF